MSTQWILTPRYPCATTNVMILFHRSHQVIMIRSTCADWIDPNLLVISTSLDSCGALVLFRFQIEQLGFMMFIHTYTFWPIHRSSDFFAAMDLSASGIFVEVFPVILWLLLYPFSAMSPRMSTCEKWWKMVKTCMAIISYSLEFINQQIQQITYIYIYKYHFAGPTFGNLPNKWPSLHFHPIINPIVKLEL